MSCPVVQGGIALLILGIDIGSVLQKEQNLVAKTKRRGQGDKGQFVSYLTLRAIHEGISMIPCSIALEKQCIPSITNRIDSSFRGAAHSSKTYPVMLNTPQRGRAVLTVNDQVVKEREKDGGQSVASTG